jgi:hypothetical protein
MSYYVSFANDHCLCEQEFETLEEARSFAESLSTEIYTEILVCDEDGELL